MLCMRACAVHQTHTCSHSLPLTLHFPTPAEDPNYLVGCFHDYAVTAADVAGAAGDDYAWTKENWAGIRNFPFAQVLKKTNSVAACEAIAAAAGSQFYGMSKGKECWWVAFERWF